MTKRAVNKKERSETGAGERSAVFYVYCIGERDALAPLFDEELPPAIEGGARLEAVEGGGLAAVVSAVPLAEYGEESLEARLTDAEWTAARAMRHESVVEHFAARGRGVVPLRFGTIYLTRSRVARMLAEKEAELRRTVERLRGREEWGVQIYCDRVRLREQIASVSERLREMSEQASKVSPGQGYLMRKKIEALRDDETRAEIKRATAEIERGLAKRCEGSTRLRMLKAEVTEHGELAAKLAFLVARERFEEFREEAESLAARYVGQGFRMELTGPWPAYNFATGDES